jgi:hypothetical protein
MRHYTRPWVVKKAGVSPGLAAGYGRFADNSPLDPVV